MTRRLGRAAIIEAQARFSADIMLTRMEAIFHDVMGKGTLVRAAIEK